MRRDAAECGRMFPNEGVLVHRRTDPLLRSDRADLHEAVGVVGRPRLERAALEEGEQAGVEADGDDEDGAGGCGVKWLAGQRADGVLHVLNDAVDPRRDPDGARLLAHARRVAQRTPCRRARVVRRDSVRSQLAALHLFVKPQLLGEVVVEAAVSDARQQAVQ